MNQAAIRTLAFLYSENPKLQLTRLEVLRGKDQVILNRVLIVAYATARSHQEAMILTLASEGYVEPQVTITGLLPQGLTLKVSIAETETHKSGEVSANFLLRRLAIERYQQFFAISQVQVEFRGAKFAKSWSLKPDGQVFANSKQLRPRAKHAYESKVKAPSNLGPRPIQPELTNPQAK